jgi:hypothetical protein
VTIAQQRAAAEQRAQALLRSIVLPGEWRYEPRLNSLGQIMRRDPTHIEFRGQLGRCTYQIWLDGTSENIRQIDANGYDHGICGGPYAYNDYVSPESYQRRRYVEMSNSLWLDARREAQEQGTQPLCLPAGDIWLGQYLALKYDEKRFLEQANIF